MHAKDSEQATATQVDKSGIRTEKRRVAELEDGAEDGGWKGHLWVRDAKFVEVVHVCQAKDEGGDKDGFGEGGACQDHERDCGGAEKDFFGQRALIVVG